MRSIRKERESLDPEKNPNWNKQVIDSLYYLCLDIIREIIPNYESDILLTEDGKFRGYRLSKSINTREVSGKFHIDITIDDTLVDEKTINERKIKFLNISVYCEGNNKDRNRSANKMVDYIFSIENNITDDNVPLTAYANDFQSKAKEFKNVIEKYL